MTCENSKRRVVLVVEDELLSRMDVVEMIEQAGLIAVAAASADEAIEILEVRDDVSVVITDIVMPGAMDGVRLAHAVHGRWPPIGIVATPGDFTLDQCALPEGGALVPKPYTPGQIINAVKAVDSSE